MQRAFLGGATTAHGFALATMTLVTVLSACGDDVSRACVDDGDCELGAVCVDRSCMPRDERDAAVDTDLPDARDGGPGEDTGPIPSIDVGPTMDATTLVCGASCDTGLPCVAGIVDCAAEPECVPRDPPSTLVEDRTILANNSSMPGTYNGQYDDFQQIVDPPPWPGNMGESIRLSLTTNQYIAAFFNSGSRDLEGVFQLAPSGNFEGPPTTRTTISISECPGDFLTHLDQDACRSNGAAISRLSWSYDLGADRSRLCVLDKDTNYYLNIVHSSSFDDGFSTSGCGFAYCGVLANQLFSEL